jgi:AcrR family transcriptional regulator
MVSSQVIERSGIPMSQGGQAMTPAATAVPTQRRITDAAITLFATKGFAATGIREIADSVGISSAALYHYMGTKDDLLVHIMTEGLARFAAASRQAIADLAGPERHLVGLTRVHVATEAVMRRMSLVIDGEVRSLRAAEEVLRLRDGYESLWAHTIALGAESGAFRVAEPGLARLALVEMCNGVAHWYKPGGRLTLGEVCDHFCNMALCLVNARDPQSGEQATTVTLGMRPAHHEIAIVHAAFESLCSADSECNDVA